MRSKYVAPMLALAGAGLVLGLSACGGSDGNTAQGVLKSFSPHANMAVGSEALVELTGVKDTSSLTVSVNGSKIDAQFRKDAAGRTVALVNGLKTGSNAVEVSSNGASVAKLQLTSYPSSGPIFSGPHQQPWICETASFALPDGSKLPASTAADCSVPTVVQYAYVNSSGNLKYLANPNVPPSDVMKTTTSSGAAVNFIIRIETGTLNRGIYQTAMLHDPSKDAAPSPFVRSAGWNGEVVYAFGGSCNPGYRQATTMGGDYKSKLYELSKGYAVASSTLNVWGNNCNSTISAETAFMVKERFTEAYGVPTAVIGQGESGGAKSQLMIVDNYPGILDGILPGIQAGGPDGMTANPSTVDCSLMVNYFDNNASMPWSYAQKTAVAGWAGWNNCQKQPSDSPKGLSWHLAFSPFYMVATSKTPPNFIGCNSNVIPANLLYDPKTNPGGAKCDLYSNQINIFGSIPSDANTVRRPMDSVGIQYGFAAFNAGTISAEQFVELNEKMGGYDADGNIISARTVADTTALKIAYQTGQVLSGGGGLNQTPIIDLRRYTENQPDLHDRLGSFITRERLIAANGNADNMVMLTFSPSMAAGPFGSLSVANEALTQMSSWLSAIRNDGSGDSVASKVRKNKPANAVDACWKADGTKIAEPASFAQNNQCNALYPAHQNPRLVAGMSLKHNVLKCQLKPIDVHDYATPPSAAQQARLQAVFSGGVCDFSKQGVEQQGLGGTWYAFPTRGQPTPLN